MTKPRFQVPKEGNHGWYACTLGTPTQYLHTDGTLHSSTWNNYDKTKSSGYFDDEQHAMDTLVNYIANNL